MIDFDALEWEWKEMLVGCGDGVTMVFTGDLWPRPVRDFSVYVVPGGLLDALIPLEDREPDRKGYCDDQRGTFLISFEGQPPPKRSEVWARWRWPVPKLRGAAVLVRRQDAKPEWVTLEELSDALQRR